MSALAIVEAAATIMGVVCVWLFIRQHIGAWPAAMGSAVLFGVVFADAGLYANMGLQGFYVALAFYGWHQWRRGGPQQEGVAVTRIALRQSFVLGAIVLVAAAVIVAILAAATRGATPTVDAVIAFVSDDRARALDALATAMSLAGTWMQAKKILENWLLWIVTDAILAGVFLSQGLYFTTALYLLYLGMAVQGYRAWRRDLD